MLVLLVSLFLFHLALVASADTLPTSEHRHRSPHPELAVNTYAVTDATLGPVFDGVGAISGGGSTSRLLPAYKPAVLSEVFDYLFLPDFAAAFHWFKVEIGGEALSSEGSEASHARSLHELQTAPNYRRGYESAPPHPRSPLLPSTGPAPLTSSVFRSVRRV